MAQRTTKAVRKESSHPSPDGRNVNNNPTEDVSRRVQGWVL